MKNTITFTFVVPTFFLRVSRWWRMIFHQKVRKGTARQKAIEMFGKEMKHARGNYQKQYVAFNRVMKNWKIDYRYGGSIPRGKRVKVPFIPTPVKKILKDQSNIEIVPPRTYGDGKRQVPPWVSYYNGPIVRFIKSK